MNKFRNTWNPIIHIRSIEDEINSPLRYITSEFGFGGYVVEFIQKLKKRYKVVIDAIVSPKEFVEYLN